MEEARKVIERLDRIEAMQSARAPASELLAEVRELLREGEAWLTAENGAVRAPGREAGAVAALAECRARLARGEVVPEAVGGAAL